MDIKATLLFGTLAILTAASWVLGNEFLYCAPKILDWVVDASAPVAIIFGAGALLGAATRAGWLRNKKGYVSLFRTGGIFIGIVVLVGLSFNRVGPRIQDLWIYLVLIASITYCFLLILRNGNIRYK